jgi:hypothetical protein
MATQKEWTSKKTIQGYAKRLKYLDRISDLNNPTAVKEHIANMDVSNAYKECVVNAYVHYIRHNSLEWKKSIYKRADRLPNVPTTEQVNKIISNAGKKYFANKLYEKEKRGNYGAFSICI